VIGHAYACSSARFRTSLESYVRVQRSLGGTAPFVCTASGWSIMAPETPRHGSISCAPSMTARPPASPRARRETLTRSCVSRSCRSPSQRRPAPRTPAGPIVDYPQHVAPRGPLSDALPVNEHARHDAEAFRGRDDRRNVSRVLQRAQAGGPSARSRCPGRRASPTNGRPDRRAGGTSVRSPRERRARRDRGWRLRGSGRRRDAWARRAARRDPRRRSTGAVNGP
jgi:hypothetical protein